MSCEKIKNLKNTEAQIAELLSKNVFNAKELQEIIKADKATIYRGVKSLLKKGVIREIQSDIKYYELNCNIHNPIHPHFECKICKKIYCLKALSAEDTLMLSRYTDFEIDSMEIILKGICNECKKS